MRDPEKILEIRAQGYSSPFSVLDLRSPIYSIIQRGA
jgi:hypothetical protein